MRAGHDLAEATPLQRDILRTLLYFDVFSHPLTAEEIYRFLPSNSVNPDVIREACDSRPLNVVVQRSGSFYSVLGVDETPEDKADRRSRKERRARTYLRIARVVARIVSGFPFVRAVFVSGELSKGVVAPSGDIDLMIVTAPNRLWIARTLLVAFKKLFLFNSKRFFCINHIVSEDNLVAGPRNLYTAVEIGTLVPLINGTLHAAYVASNAWIEDFLPNIRPAELSNTARPQRRTLIQRTLELPFRGSLGDRLDLRLLAFWKQLWENRYPDLPSHEREVLFRCERSISTAYAGDFLPKVLTAYDLRLRTFHLAV